MPRVVLRLARLRKITTSPPIPKRATALEPQAQRLCAREHTDVDMRVAARSRCILRTGVVILYLWWFARPFSKRFREGRPTTSPRETATPTYTTTHAFEQVRLARSEVRTPRNSTDGLSARVERRPGLYQDCLCARGDIETRCSCKENTRNCASQQP